ncbi:MAG TPA: hypothetical protein VMV87_13015, partial [Burkholderiales bacterium]|nr:hypothetical protein [Burkholderiales bacterium]
CAWGIIAGAGCWKWRRKAKVAACEAARKDAIRRGINMANYIASGMGKYPRRERYYCPRCLAGLAKEDTTVRIVNLDFVIVCPTCLTRFPNNELITENFINADEIYDQFKGVWNRLSALEDTAMRRPKKKGRAAKGDAGIGGSL